jgi:hypothetical protein
MFNETGLGGAINFATSSENPDAIWRGLFDTRKAWKQAGKPGWSNTGEQPTIVRAPGTGPVGDAGTVDTGAAQVDQTPVEKGGIADFLSGIPSSWLLIGGVVLLVVVLKK